MLLSICLIFCQFQPSIAYKKQRVYAINYKYTYSKQKRLCGWDNTKLLTLLYFHCGPFKIKYVLNLKKGEKSSIKTWKYNTSYIPVRIIVP